MITRHDFVDSLFTLPFLLSTCGEGEICIPDKGHNIAEEYLILWRHKLEIEGHDR